MANYVEDLLERSSTRTLVNNPELRSSEPRQHALLITCMDTRINPYRIMNITEGDVHILRNAGGIVTPDVIRSLAISQRKLRTTEIAVIQHTDCGMAKFDGAAFKHELEAECGYKLEWDVGTFADVYASVRDSIASLKSCDFLETAAIVGYVYDVYTDTLQPVDPR